MKTELVAKTQLSKVSTNSLNLQRQSPMTSGSLTDQFWPVAFWIFTQLRLCGRVPLDDSSVIAVQITNPLDVTITLIATQKKISRKISSYFLSCLYLYCPCFVCSRID